jgi:hypothetical protein
MFLRVLLFGGDFADTSIQVPAGGLQQVCRTLLQEGVPALSYKFIMETTANERFHHYGLNHRAAMIDMETLAIFYNSEEKEVGMGTPDKWITGRTNNKEAKPLVFSQRKFLVEDAAKV